MALTRLHSVVLPLDGGPRFLRLHHAVIIERLGIDSSLFQIDFLPVAPRDAKNVVMLLAGRSVAGVIRHTRLRRWPKYISVKQQPTQLSDCFDELKVLKRVESGYDLRLNLIGNNCASFAEEFIKEAKSESESQIGSCDPTPRQ